MSLINKLFLVICFIFSVLFYQDQAISEQLQLAISGLLIITFGVPHGAIDHVLFSETKKLPQGIFYLYYFGVMLIYLLLWIVYPLICLTLFIFLSAYHFGQSQFIPIVNKPKITDYALYLSWGLSILSGLFLYNHLELMELLNKYPDTLVFKDIFNVNILQIVLVLSTLISLLLIFNKTFQNSMDLKTAIEEIVVLFIIHLAFWLIPLILAFTLYFVIMHSLKVIFQEFEYLLKSKKTSGLKHFIVLLIPNTFVSIVVLAIFVFLYFNNVFNFSLNLMLFVMISLITLPHAIVMDKFYDSLPFRKNKKNNKLYAN